MRLLITGTPCTGKSTLGLELSQLLGCPFVRVNDVVDQLGCFKLDKKEGTKIVDLKILEKNLKKILLNFGRKAGRGKNGGNNKNIVVEGHLLCDVKLPCEKMVVLRCDPVLLEKRMQKRKWSKAKISENLLAETLDYCLTNSEQNYGKKKVVQIKFTNPPSVKKAWQKIAASKGDEVDWTRRLLARENAV